MTEEEVVRPGTGPARLVALQGLIAVSWLAVWNLAVRRFVRTPPVQGLDMTLGQS
jgi:hypothetical protein